MLRPGIEPVISFTGARDYARSAVASWTTQRHSAKAWLQGHGKSSHGNNQLCWKAPWRYFAFSIHVSQLVAYETVLH